MPEKALSQEKLKSLVEQFKYLRYDCSYTMAMALQVTLRFHNLGHSTKETQKSITDQILNAVGIDSKGNPLKVKKIAVPPAPISVPRKKVSKAWADLHGTNFEGEFA